MSKSITDLDLTLATEASEGEAADRMEILEGTSQLSIEEAASFSIKVADKEEDLRASMISLEQAITVQGRRDTETISFLEQARWKLVDAEKARKREETKVKLREMRKLCGNRLSEGLPGIFPEEVGQGNRMEPKPSEPRKVANGSDLIEGQTDKGKCNDLFAEILPDLLKHLSINDMLTSRLVCRNWMTGIDSFLADCHSLSPLHLDIHMECKLDLEEEEEIPPCPALPSSCVVVLFSTEDVQRFNQNVGGQAPTEKYPFLSRSLTIGPLDDEPIMCWEEARLVLVQHGHKLWHLLLMLGDMADDEQFARIPDFLQLTPNLRSLEICTGNMNRTRVASHVALRASQALPDLPRLVLLATHHLITCWGTSVRPPRLVTYDGVSDDCVGLKGAMCPNIGEMRVRHVALGRHPFPYRNDLYQVLAKLNSFENTSLRHLFLQLYSSDGPVHKVDSAVGRSVWMNLPNLETLELSLLRVNLKSVDFLLPCRSLRNLSLRYFKKATDPVSKPKSTESHGLGAGKSDDASAESGREEIVQFTEYTNRLYESNIWKLFPYLNQVRIEITRVRKVVDAPGMPLRVMWFWEGSKSKVYTRDEYEGTRKKSATQPVELNT